MYAVLLILSTFCLLNINAYPRDSPVQISIENAKMGEGSRIDLAETYHPLSSAKATQDAKLLARTHSRAYAPRPFLHSQPSLPLEKAEEIQLQPETPYGATGWLPWSDWSECINGEKIRYRSCIPNAYVNCVGIKIEKQPCSMAEPVEIPFASDPWAIEREITLEGIERPPEV